MVAREPICSVNRRKGRRVEQIGLGLQSADWRTTGAEGDGQSRGGRADGRSRIGGRADGELDAGGAPPNSRFVLFSPPPLSSLFPPLSLPSRAEAMRRPAREYRHAISRARPLCSISPALARRRRVFFNLFPARATALPSVWRPPDALATPWRARRRHTNDGRGGGDAPIRSLPGHQGDA